MQQEEGRAPGGIGKLMGIAPSLSNLSPQHTAAHPAPGSTAWGEF